jgi:hypothetical protein
MRDNGFLKRLHKKAKRGLRGWPLATIAFYGPNLSQATKAAVGIIPSENAEAEEMRASHVLHGDIREDVPARGLQAAAARLAQVRARLGRRARRRAGHREKLELTNQTLVRVASGIGVHFALVSGQRHREPLPGEDRR